jgi:hypothetical protein
MARSLISSLKKARATDKMIEEIVDDLKLSDDMLECGTYFSNT